MHDKPNTRRRRLGSYYTPDDLAEALARVALERCGPEATVGDPACGDGAFLLAAAKVLHEKGAPPRRIVTEQLRGADIDRAALRGARDRLLAWAEAHGEPTLDLPDRHLAHLDALAPTPGTSWLDEPGTFDAVIGNPPFGSQLKSLTAYPASRRVHLETTFGLGPLGYADLAGLFALRALELVTPGGVVSMILPTSLLTARDAAGIRDRLRRDASLVGIWIGGDRVGFDAAVAVWAPILHAHLHGESPQTVARYGGRDVRLVDHQPYDPNACDWVDLVGELSGGPVVGALSELAHDGRTLGDLAEVTAGFRRHFYGLEPFVEDDPTATADSPELLTSGSIDPMRRRVDVTTRYAGRRFHRPVVDLAELAGTDPKLAAWVQSMRTPKVLVAPQGKVIEAVVDREGRMIPSTPVIAVRPAEPSDIGIEHLAALLSSPVATALMHRHAAGSGLAWGQCRVSAGFLRKLPVPMKRSNWDRAAKAAARATEAADRENATAWDAELDTLAAEMATAYGLTPDHPIQLWWRNHRPSWRSVERLGP